MSFNNTVHIAIELSVLSWLVAGRLVAGSRVCIASKAAIAPPSWR